MSIREQMRKNWLHTVFLTVIGVLTAANLFFILQVRQSGAGPGTESTSAERHSAELLVSDMQQAVFPYDPYLDNGDGFWEIAGPGESGFEEKGIQAYLKLCRLTGADAALVVNGNTILGEWYAPDYRPPIGAMSSTKSVTAILAGIMEDEGLISITDALGKYLPQWDSGVRAGVTIEHLLSQTSGLLRQTSDENSVGYRANKNEFVINLLPEAEPGSRWSYSNEGYQLLSPIMEKAVGRSLNEYAAEKLFIPLGMENTRLMVSGPGPDTWTYADMLTTPRDFARIGVMVQSGGTWRDKRVISAEYLNRAFAPSELNPMYGYGWWLLNAPDHIDAVAARGYLSTDMYVLKEANLVIVRMQRPQGLYTGEDESGAYSQVAREVINAIVKKTSLARLDELMEELSDSAATEDVASLLDRATRLSRNGNEDEVIELAHAVLQNPHAKREHLAKAAATMSLQYIRKRDADSAGEYLSKAQEYGIEDMGAYWKDSYDDMVRMVQSIVK